MAKNEKLVLMLKAKVLKANKNNAKVSSKIK
jgi:hypothetical protein